MKYLNKEVIKTITIVLLSVLFIFTIFKKEKAIENQSKPSVEYKDTKGNQYSQKQVEDAEKKELENIIDSLKLSLKNKGSVKSIVVAPVKTDTFLKEIPIYIKDGVKVFNYNDNYLNLYGKLDSTKVNIHYSASDTLMYITHVKKYLFKENVTYVDIVNKNPYNHITITKSLEVKNKKPVIVLGPSVFYNPFQNNFGVGISLTYNLLSLKK